MRTHLGMSRIQEGEGKGGVEGVGRGGGRREGGQAQTSLHKS